MTRMERKRRRFGIIAATVELLLVAVVVLMILTSDAEDREEDAPAVSKQAAYRAQMPELVIECDPDSIERRETNVAVAIDACILVPS